MNEQEALRWKRIACELWGLLDDIDTADDMARDDDYAYRQIVHRKHVMRHKHLVSDGYSLYFPEDLQQREIKDLINQLRNKDCVSIETCYKGHGNAWFVYLGDGDKKHIAGNGDSLEEALVDAVRKEFYTASDKLPADGTIDHVNDCESVIDEENKVSVAPPNIIIEIGNLEIQAYRYIEIMPGGVIVDDVKEFDTSEVDHWHGRVQTRDVKIIKGQVEFPSIVDGESILYTKYVPKEESDVQSNSS